MQIAFIVIPPKLFLLRILKLSLHTTCILVRLLLQYILVVWACQFISCTSVNRRNVVSHKNFYKIPCLLCASDFHNSSEHLSSVVSTAQRSCLGCKFAARWHFYKLQQKISGFQNFARLAKFGSRNFFFFAIYFLPSFTFVFPYIILYYH